MTGVQYLTDQEGKPRAVVLPIELWRRLLPREDASVEELTDAVEDYCLGKAMDEGRQTPLLSCEKALEYLERLDPVESATASRSSAISRSSRSTRSTAGSSPDLPGAGGPVRELPRPSPSCSPHPGARRHPGRPVVLQPHPHGTLLTLYVVPAMYSYLTAKEWKRAEVERRTAAVSGEAVGEPVASGS